MEVVQRVARMRGDGGCSAVDDMGGVDGTGADYAPGADPATLRSRLHSLDTNVDVDYFAYVWTLLARHPNLQVVIAADALPVGDVGAPTEERGPSPPPDPADDGRELFRVLGEDDGGSPPVARTDLGGLQLRYPQRVRIRCTEDEIYYRLTGSRSKVRLTLATRWC